MIPATSGLPHGLLFAKHAQGLLFSHYFIIINRVTKNKKPSYPHPERITKHESRINGNLIQGKPMKSYPLIRNS